MKIALVGGHLTPALALIDYCQANHPEDELVFFGRLFARTSSKQPAHERDEVFKRQVAFIPFNSGKIYNQPLLPLLKNLILLLVSLPKALVLLIKHRPDVLVSFGSYLAVPMALAAWLLRIPVVTHEQTQTTGLANKIIALFAQTVAVSHKNSLVHFPKKKTFLTGPLIRDQVMAEQQLIPSWINPKNQKPIIYITGGSQGSEIINCTVAQALLQLTQKWFVIHQCGSKSDQRDYYKELINASKKLSSGQKAQYVVFEWLSEKELAWIFKNASLVVARAGANTTVELSFHAVPSVLIPLPFSNNHEQLKNAQSLAQAGGAVILEQKNLNAKKLIETIEVVMTQKTQMKQALNKIKPKLGLKSVYNLIRDAGKN